jgi:NAD(P)-dependent dehydrogenase (short-subunit alcohol dehydrogenase family)
MAPTDTGLLSGKTAVVTGGSSGIGRAIASTYADHGANVVVGDIRREPRRGGPPTVERIREAGGEARFVEADVTEYADVETLVEVAVEEYGAVDVMVNNAGILQQTRLHETTADQWAELMDINVTGVFHGTKAAVSRMLDQETGGNVVNVSSISGSIGRAEAPAYCASKGAVTMLTRQNAIDYGPEGIRVNAVGPGGTLTAMVYEVMSEPRREYLEGQTPLRRLAEPEEVADAATFLASDMASYVNGHVLFVDGGFSIT